MSEPLVRRTDRKGMATIELNRPERKNAIMQGFAANLSEQDRADLAAWYASQDGLRDLSDR